MKVDVLVQPAPLVYKATRHYIKSETEESDEGKKSSRKLMKMIFPWRCWCFLQPHGPLIIVRVKKEGGRRMRPFFVVLLSYAMKKK
jgi:geranylgeranyl pyrophosphate synthase